MGTPEVESVEYVVEFDGGDVDWFQDKAEAIARAEAGIAEKPGPWKVVKRTTYCCDTETVFGDPDDGEDD